MALLRLAGGWREGGGLLKREREREGGREICMKERARGENVPQVAAAAALTQRREAPRQV